MGFFERIIRSIGGSIRSVGGRQRPSAPLLVRVFAVDGSMPDTVSIESVWAPSGRRDVRTAWTAQGVCLLAWREGERSVDVVLRARGGSTRLTALDGDDEGLVRDAVLVADSATADDNAAE